MADGNGTHAPGQEIGLAITCTSAGQVLMNETDGPDLRKLRMLVACCETVLVRMEQGMRQSGLWVPPSARTG